MHIRALVGAAVLALCTLAFAPVAMADTAPEFYVLDLAQPASFDAVVADAPDFCAVVPAEVTAYGDSHRGCQGDADLTLFIAPLETFDFAVYRPHEDPGRSMT